MTFGAPRSKSRILSAGEVLWDVLPAGPQLGGAPANFAFHAHALGANAALISRVGDDALGNEILKRFRDRGIPTELIQREEEHDTGSVHVELSGGGQPRYHIVGDVAWDHLHATDRALEAAGSADAICFGTLAQRSAESREAIRAIVSATPESAWRICDINLREPFVSEEVICDSLAIANALKLNDEELPTVAAIYQIAVSDFEAMLSRIASKAGLRVIALTRGSHGSVIWKDGAISQHPGISAEVRDTVGAGDAFTAALAIGLLAGWPVDRINAQANEVAAFVCSQSGATPELPERLTSAFLPGESLGRD